ncbi:MAG: hypothetical protein COV10_01995 [Candidatus Vogelbacteria bacterium CG10_big_fil_rev_8_21_14_0_10_51_16]|uniref:Glycosyltransferase n=1 Tax=Candidatus Vogelbacteria bacterium CG10_big_fil_rev_8_21_14_0_10_51_16 TaxID=1975045 RepID=A0A2H0RER9_9BACT|nr:MAG: hypothetical protein COV10_01995 [Candidatus Vogelbacteria bacterium CG10_big_fil_rev_8_21_14_0_10_51_16]
MNKKILIIINNLGIGGAERLVAGDINEMLRMGIDVSLVTLVPEPPKSFASVLHLKLDRFRCIHFKHFLDIPAWFKLGRFIRVSKPNLVITHLWFANTIGRIAAKIAGAKNVVSFEHNVYDTVKTGKMFFVDRCLQFLSNKIIAVSDAVKESLVRHAICESKIEVLCNGIDTKPFSVTCDRLKIRREYGVPENVFLYLFIGRLIHQKAVDILIEAFKRIETDACLLIVGQGKDRDMLEELVKKLGLQKRVIFAGIRNDVPQLLMSSDCFVLPSRHEGLPMVLIEALAAGAATIVSDFASAGEVVTHEKNGLILPREDVDALAHAMMRIKNDANLRESLILESKRSAERFSISNHVEALARYIT